MAWTTPTTRTTGDLISAAIYNNDAVDNPIALRSGSLSLNNQAAGHFVIASSTAQLSADSDEQVVLFIEMFGY